MILPVRNGAATLSSLLSQIVEILPELTPHWDLLVVDDGSTDATPEVLQELTRPYPQIRVIHHSVPQGDGARAFAVARWARGATSCCFGLATATWTWPAFTRCGSGAQRTIWLWPDRTAIPPLAGCRRRPGGNMWPRPQTARACK